MSWSALPPEMREQAERLLTSRQLQVFKLAQAGYGSRRIALVLGVSRSSVRDALDAAQRKLTGKLSP